MFKVIVQSSRSQVENNSSAAAGNGVTHHGWKADLNWKQPADDSWPANMPPVLVLDSDFDFDFQLRFYTSLDPKQVKNLCCSPNYECFVVCLANELIN